MELIELLGDAQIVRSAVALLLAVLTVFAFGRLLFFKDNEEQRWQKIFGALTILVVALISENGWAISISVVIGGLIVASEEFMRFVAAIFKSSPDKIAETVKAFKATPDEIENKLTADVKEEFQISPAPQEQPVHTSSERALERLERVRKVEAKVQSYLAANLKGYEANQKISTKLGSIIVDGLIRRSSGKIGAIVEIRYITAKSFPNLRFLISHFYTKLTRIGVSKRVLVTVVSEEMSAAHAKQMLIDNSKIASLMFFKLTGEDLEKIEPEIDAESAIID